MREFWPAPLPLALELGLFDHSVQSLGFDRRIEQGQPAFGSEGISFCDFHERSLAQIGVPENGGHTEACPATVRVGRFAVRPTTTILAMNRR